jgi:uncharacterized protein YndB with AHSA1/START domain
MKKNDETLVVNVQMLIRRPPSEVFRAFVEPSITTRFWFSRSTGPLAPGARVTWTWDTYGVSDDVVVKAFEPDRRLLIEWPAPVEWRFEPHADGTLVRIRCTGFDSDDAIAKALDNQGGFSFVLAGCKAWLEHGIELGLVPDHAPDQHVAADTDG